MWIETHAETSESPAEYKASDPITCSTCGQEHDEEDDFKVTFDYISTEAYCITLGSDCYKDASRVCFRKEVCELIVTAIAELQEQIAEVSEELGTDYGGGEGSPLNELDDIIGRLPRWEAGKDTGYRGGVMMTPRELVQLRAEARNNFDGDLMDSIMRRSAGIDA